MWLNHRCMKPRGEYRYVQPGMQNRALFSPA